MVSICLACVIYTLKDKDPADNLYLNVLHQWLTMVIKNGGLTNGDILHIHIDEVTFDYLQNNKNILIVLLEMLPCDYKFQLFEQPETSLEGMMNKYVFTEYSQDVYIYSDIDVLVMKPFRSMLNVKENTIYPLKALSLDHNFYSEGFPPEFPLSSSLPGFNASIFLVMGKDLRDSFFNRIHTICDYSTKYECVEQPYFNRAIYEMPRNLVNIDLLGEYVSFSSFNKDDTKSIFVDLSGDTSNGISHLRAMSDMISLYILQRT
jgi:hypothetical protein